MATGSTAPHRAFMGVAGTACILLILVLVGGWRWYFQDIEKRQVILERAKVHEARLRDLEKLGLDAETGIVSTSSAKEAPIVSLQSMAPKEGGSSGVVPPPGDFKDLPLQETSPDYIEAIEALEKYWKAVTIKDRLPCVYDPERVKPLMEDFYDRQKETDPDHHELRQKTRFMLDGREEILYFSFTSSRVTGMVEVAMRRGQNGRFLVDWESLTGFTSPAFAELKKLKPTEPSRIRAFVKLFDYYNYEFTDSSRYLCVKLIAANGVDTLYGYAERESELGKWLVQVLDNNRKNNSLSGQMLAVSFPENAQSDQCVLINRVLNARWLNLDN
jgi:hypothetical protein